MILSTRLRFVAAVTVTVLGITLVAVYAWRAFGEVSAELRDVERYLSHVRALERIEEDLHELGARTGVAAEHEATLAEHMAEFAGLAAIPEEGDLPSQLRDKVAIAHRTGESQAWAGAAEVVSRMVKRDMTRLSAAVEQTSDPARDSARVTLRLAAGTVIGFAILALLTFLQHRREQREASDRLRKADRLAALGTMAASVAHEINNPLATVAGCATAVRDRLRRNASEHEDSIEYLGMIETETKRCSGIVAQLHDLSRDAPPAMAPTDLARLSREVVAFFEMNRAGPKVDVQADGELEAVCDPDKVKQLLLNLLVNARDAAGDGGRVRVTVARSDPATARISVEDDGVGMSPSELTRAFEPFHTTKTRGLGLGLFLCERVATLHGGSIRAESAGRGHGARFVVTLPTRLSGSA